VPYTFPLSFFTQHTRSQNKNILSRTPEETTVFSTGRNASFMKRQTRPGITGLLCAGLAASGREVHKEAGTRE
jgi:hypothetical protein